MEQEHITFKPAPPRERLRVLHILPSLGVGGAEQMATHLMIGLSQSYDVGAVSLAPPWNSTVESRLKEANIPAWFLEKGPGFAPGMYVALHRVVREFQPDIVHTHLSVLRYAFPVLVVNRAPVTVHTLHNLAEHEADSAGRAVQQLAFRGRVLPVAISQECGASFRRVYRRECCAIIPNGIPVDSYRRDPADRAHTRQELGLDATAIVFTCVARLEPQKNPLMLIRAFAALSDSRAHLLLLGDGALKEEVALTVREHGLADRVHMLGKRYDIQKWLAASDVFVLSSAWEGSPLAAMEAMASGLPMVTTAVGGMPELAEGERQALLVPPGDRVGFTAAMRKLLHDPEKRLAMGESARARAMRWFSAERMVQAYARLYESGVATSYRRRTVPPPRPSRTAPEASHLKIVFVTAQLPHGPDEVFFMPEVQGLERIGHTVLVVPRSPRGPIVHAHDELLRKARCEDLYSGRVLKSAAAVALRSPARTVAAIWSLRKSRSLAVGLKNLAIVPKALWLADTATQWKADHIHCHWAGTTATMAMLASRVSGIPWSFTTHRWDVVENNLLPAKVKSASFARFISEDGLRIAKELGVDPGDNVCVLHMGVSIPESPSRRAQSKPVVLCPARLVEVKGHRFLLLAWQALRERGVDAELRFAGQGPLRPQLEEIAATLGVADCVRFLGEVPHRELMSLYEESSAVVLPSLDLGGGLREGIPVALMEAMSHGIPVVATRTGGVPELVSPGAGLLVPPADPIALADAIQRILQDGELQAKLGSSGRERVKQCYDVVGVVSELSEAMKAAAAGLPPFASRASA